VPPTGRRWLLPISLIAASLLGVLVAGYVIFDAWMMESSDLYREAVRRTQLDPLARETIGSPMEFKTLSADIPIDRDALSSHASGEISVSGPSGAGVINIVGRKEAGVWTYPGFTLTVGDRRIDLRTDTEKMDSAGSQSS
jgi:hypothetical protein